MNISIQRHIQTCKHRERLRHKEKDFLASEQQTNEPLSLSREKAQGVEEVLKPSVLVHARVTAWLTAALRLRRVYKNFDPRAKIIREVAEEVFEIQGRDPLIDVAVELEKRARSDDYFVSRNLYPNVDFYSGACRALSVAFSCFHAPCHEFHIMQLKPVLVEGGKIRPSAVRRFLLRGFH